MPVNHHTAEHRAQLMALSRAELVDLARRLALPGESRMRKSDLVELLLQAPGLPALLAPPGRFLHQTHQTVESGLLLRACIEYSLHDRRAFVSPAIPRRRLEAAVTAFSVPPERRIMALFDNTPGGGGQFGMLVTDWGLYWRNLRTSSGDAERGRLSWQALQGISIRMDADTGDLYAGHRRINAQRLQLPQLLGFIYQAIHAFQQIDGESTVPKTTCRLEQAHCVLRTRGADPATAALVACLLHLGQDDADELAAQDAEVAKALHLSHNAWAAARKSAGGCDPLVVAQQARTSSAAEGFLWECLLALSSTPAGDPRASSGLERLARACGVGEPEWQRYVSLASAQAAGMTPWLAAADYVHPRPLRGRMAPAPSNHVLPVTAQPMLSRALTFLAMAPAAPIGRAAVRTPLGTARTVSLIERTGSSLSTRTEFSFEPLGGSGSRLCLALSGYLSADSEHALQWGPLRQFAVGAECYAVRWESQAVRALSSQLLNISLRSAGRALFRQVSQQPFTVVAPSAALPGLVVEYAHSLDRSWREAVESSEATAQQLAQHLRERTPRGRAVSLVGFSLGSRVIFRTLEELARSRDQGIVSEVILLGGAFSANESRWRSVRSVVSGRIVNAYCRTDYILRYLYRAAEWERQIAGLLPAQAEGIEDVDVTEIAGGHLGYRRQLRRIMERVFGADPAAD